MEEAILKDAPKFRKQSKKSHNSSSEDILNQSISDLIKFWQKDKYP